MGAITNPVALFELWNNIIVALGGSTPADTTERGYLEAFQAALTSAISSGAPAASTVTGPPAFGAAAVVGTGTSFARNDHIHGLPTGGTLSGAMVFSNASIHMTALPAADPHVVGALWANAGVVTVSAG
jgi:hypothetical protein